MAATAVGGTGGRGGKWRRGRQRRQMGEINVTPFVDVMLVLLIVFMVTAPMLTMGVSVDLPRADSSPMPGQDEPLSVSIDASGTIFLQETAIELDQLAPRLLAITEQNAEARIFVRGDRAIDYGRVMAVIGNLNRAGFTKVALLTEQPDLVVAE
ncbi:MAG: protein TolR [Geminicoccaceae bacterium]|jgi:biopolymer transport protein TolR|nr:protein TolR [Geminicoccaceae bacterium]HRY23312.1 protein TolR [Geminicoccaceae bacterium]